MSVRKCGSCGDKADKKTPGELEQQVHGRRKGERAGVSECEISVSLV